MDAHKDKHIEGGDSPLRRGGGFSRFAQLVASLGSRTKTNEKLEALVDYFSVADDRDKVWTIAIFSGRRPKRPVNTTQLAAWCVELARLEWWLFEESYHVVGDLAETIALLLPEYPRVIAGRQEKTLDFYLQKLLQLAQESEEERKEFIKQSWLEMDAVERFVFNKFFTGGFRIGVSQKLMVNALAKVSALPSSVIAHRISGQWDPATIDFGELLSEEHLATDASKPYPFYLAYALEDEPEGLGEPADWQAEWKWDGIRGQLIKRNGELFVWSRGEELVTEKFPEYHELKDLLPDGVALDGEIIGLPRLEDQPMENGIRRPLPFAALQTRIGRKNITKKHLKETPVGFIAYDLLEYTGEDWRDKPLQERRAKLEELITGLPQERLSLSPVIDFSDWNALKKLRENSREINAEGIMLKRKNAPYQVGRKRGDWWKWKIGALTIDCVMIYAQKGAGRRSNLYTAYTFAVRDGDALVPFTRAYSGLTDKEILQVDAFVKRNALEKFGPVRTVKPELVFEIAFEGIAASGRHKSGVALRFPRISRWRKDKPPEEINTLDDLREMLERYGK
ncbi:MAG: ATP-dependent DNA ligase [Flavisolibacter sp.]